MKTTWVHLYFSTTHLETGVRLEESLIRSYTMVAAVAHAGPHPEIFVKTLSGTPHRCMSILLTNLETFRWLETTRKLKTAEDWSPPHMSICLGQERLKVIFPHSGCRMRLKSTSPEECMSSHVLVFIAATCMSHFSSFAKIYSRILLDQVPIIIFLSPGFKSLSLLKITLKNGKKRNTFWTKKNKNK